MLRAYTKYTGSEYQPAFLESPHRSCMSKNLLKQKQQNEEK